MIGITLAANRPAFAFTAAGRAWRPWLGEDCPAACRAPWRPSERPWCALFGALLNPTFPPSTTQALELVEAARALGRPIIVLKASTDGELDAALATLARQGIVAMLVAAAPFFDTRRDKIIAFAAQQKLPAIYHFREYALAGGLIECRPLVPFDARCSQIEVRPYREKSRERCINAVDPYMAGLKSRISLLPHRGMCLDEKRISCGKYPGKAPHPRGHHKPPAQRSI